MPLLTTGAGLFPAGSSFTPASLSGLIAWYKADTGVTNTGNNTAATAWADNSGQGNNLGTAGSDPKYFTAGFNGLPSVTFAAASGNLLQKLAFAIGTGNKASFFVVCQMLTGTTAFGRLISYSQSTGHNDFDNAGSAAAILRDAANNGFATYDNASQRCTTSISLATNYRLGMIFDGTNITPYVNGVAGTPSAYSSSWVSGGPLSIGNNFNQNAGWDGAVAEIVITNSDITSQVAQLDSYLQTRLGL
jgi:hypothetical protein